MTISTIAEARDLLVCRGQPLTQVGTHWYLDGQPLSGKQLMELARKLDDESGDKPTKYNAVRTTVGDVTFASKAEARRYEQLRQMEQAREICSLELQPRYELQPAFVDGDGVRHRPVVYVADFSYIAQGRIVVEDVKGMETDLFKLKLKLLRFQYPHLLFRIVR